jgi:quercetin dioxygenase-like cupin family protein
VSFADHLRVREHGSKPERTETITAAGVTLIEWRFKAGSGLLSEVHTYDHLSILISGEGILETDGTEKRLVGPCTLEMKAGVEHAFYAITDCVWDCIHAGGEPSVERNL